MNMSERNQLVEENMGLVHKTAKQFRDTDMPYEDLIQEGNIGLIRAAEKFDPNRGIKFSTYAVWWIRQFMSRASIADKTVRIPDWAIQIRAKVFREIFVQRLLHGRTVDADTIIDEKIEKKCQRKTIERLYNLPPRSMDEVIYKDGGFTLHDIKADENTVSPERVAIARERLNRVADALKELSYRQRAVLVMRWEGLTLEQCGRELGVTRERARQVQNAGLENLNRLIDDEAVKPTRQFRQKKAG